MALQAVSEAIEKLAATDGLEARRDALALLLDTCESCYGKDAVALGNVMRSNEGRGLRVLCELLNLCHDRAWSSWLLQHGAERRLEELSRSSDATIQRYASGTLMNVSSSTHATLAGGAQAAGKPAKYNSRVQPPAWLIEAWAEQEAAEAAAAAQAAAAERAAQQRATAAANAAAAAKAAYYNSGGAMVDAAVGAPAPGATNRAAALARRREAAPPPMARATADVAPLYARRQAPPQSTSAPPSVFHDGASIYFNQNQRLLQYEPTPSATPNRSASWKFYPTTTTTTISSSGSGSLITRYCLISG
ncbi:hypothetical protein Ctob_008797 [Chrysochromulina tobinii]|uniref:Uncharacterized protein n=1 Tax=Chrysochromulina tobinii TaxID=1460289 RepID=A0A0M0K377_9EUKA|nr:hypothetical protein Ctob_008797 [Chrysochromulina tobinii]|eukprot:KOO33037.1 hypothetical protein Ctob_008797 [Chrysochromulina sp. CCMP291]